MIKATLIRCLCSLWASIIALLILLPTVQAETDPPNIIFILADDLGYMDLVAYASHVSGESRDLFFDLTHEIEYQLGL